ncbi:MAG TPA: apolipoprotein N-acyltransferase [bacterium]|nr:apolipoprotein N-acyltransferase [bacterium]
MRQRQEVQEVSRQGRVALAALGGVLLAAAFPPLDLGVLGWVALVPLLVAARRESPAGAFRLGLVTGGVAYVIILAWMRVFGLPAWLLLAAYLAVFPGVFAGLWRWISDGRSPHVAVWSVPLLWTSLEYVRSIGVMGFPWALLGLTQYRVPEVIQVAAVTGVFGVSFVVALGSAVIGEGVAGRRWPHLLLPVVLLAVVTLGGWVFLPPPLRSDLTVAALQPNIPSRLKFDPLYTAQHMDTLRRLTLEAGRQGASVIVMPETAVPANLFGRGGALREVGGWATRARATVIATGMENGVSNIAVAIAPSGDAVSRYDKVRLVAFGEFGVRPGLRHDPLWTPQARVGVAVCFESIFPDVSRALVRGGAEILAVVTNDGWFDGAGGGQHAAHAVLRAVETGRWVVRAANTGLTMIVDPAGRIRDRIPPNTEGVLTGTVSLVRADPPYARFGDVFAVLVLLTVAAVAVPPLRATVARDARTPAFLQSLAALGLPLAAVWVLIGLRPGGLWPVVLLALVAVFSAQRPMREWGFTLRGSLPGLLAGLAVVGALGGGLVLAFRAYAIPVGLPLPPGGWAAGVLRALVAALALEGWLRGIAFAPIAEWKGRGAAIAAATAAGMLVQRGLGAEALAWAMVTGAAFGAIRARTGSALGLVVPHAAGSLLFSILAAVR